ncbi:hypothetical protein Enr10x_57800 [Gimesia panareensis]|uniref:Uncharacterized protein n=1 Tax=Gimesia panareensis TaxID=2527978 RepID=A0A517QFM1_9PLAN|nr:hypothetical protein Enr10x_57800 [Gimesia panareensis]
MIHQSIECNRGSIFREIKDLLDSIIYVSIKSLDRHLKVFTCMINTE